MTKKNNTLPNRPITYLVDTENKHHTFLEELEKVRKGDEVFLVVSPKDKLDYSGIDLIQQCKGKVYMDLGVPGTLNALDFQLSSLLGLLVARDPFKMYIIVSKDNGFTTLANYFQQKGVSVHTCEEIGGTVERLFINNQVTPVPLRDTPNNNYQLTSANIKLFGDSGSIREKVAQSAIVKANEQNKLPEGVKQVNQNDELWSLLEEHEEHDKVQVAQVMKHAETKSEVATEQPTASESKKSTDETSATAEQPIKVASKPTETASETADKVEQPTEKVVFPQPKESVMTASGKFIGTPEKKPHLIESVPDFDFEEPEDNWLAGGTISEGRATIYRNGKDIVEAPKEETQESLLLKGLVNNSSQNEYVANLNKLYEFNGAGNPIINANIRYLSDTLRKKNVTTGPRANEALKAFGHIIYLSTNPRKAVGACTVYMHRFRGYFSGKQAEKIVSKAIESAFGTDLKNYLMAEE